MGYCLLQPFRGEMIPKDEVMIVPPLIVDMASWLPVESEAINHRYPPQKISIAVAPEKRGPERKVVFQPSIFWGYVSCRFRKCKSWNVIHHEHYSHGMVQWYPQNSLSMLITGNKSGSWKGVFLLGSSCSGALSIFKCYWNM